MGLVRKLAAAGVLAIAGLVPLTGMSGAQSIDYGESCTLGFAPPPPFAAGATVTIDGDGFQPNFGTEILFDGAAMAAGSSDRALVTTDALGSFTIAVTIPADADPGLHVLSARCSDAGLPNEFEVEILGSTQVPPTGPGDPGSGTGGRTTTPRTGTDTDPLIVAGIGAVLAGSALVAAARRRRREGSRS